MIHASFMRCGFGWRGAVAIGAFLLTGCVGAGVDETLLPARINYQCANNKVLPVQRAADASSAAVLIDDKPVIMQRAGSAAQEKYSDGSYALYLDGERAMFEKDGVVLFGPCMSGPLPTYRRAPY